MSDSFKDREKGFENKFAHDQELQFRATARRNRLVGHWAARAARQDRRRRRGLRRRGGQGRLRGGRRRGRRAQAQGRPRRPRRRGDDPRQARRMHGDRQGAADERDELTPAPRIRGRRAARISAGCASASIAVGSSTGGTGDEALGVGEAEGAHEAELVGPLDALGGDRDAGPPRQREDRAHQLERRRVAEVLHEGAVELDAVVRQARRDRRARCSRCRSRRARCARRARSARSSCAVVSGLSRISTVSVISSSSRSGATPAAASAASISATKPGWWNCSAETLTDSASRRGQRAAAASAVRSAQAPSGRISPVASASGMKAAGASSPRLGCRQRSSASTPLTRPSARSR